MHRVRFWVLLVLLLSGCGRRGEPGAAEPKVMLAAEPEGDSVTPEWAAARLSLLIKDYPSPVHGVAFSPDGKRILVAMDDKLTVCDAITGKNSLRLQGQATNVRRVDWGKDGKHFASSHTDGSVRLWDATTGQVVFTLTGHAQGAFAVALSANGKRIASAGGDGAVKVWNATTGEETLTLKGHVHTVYAVAFSPDGKQLASAGYDQRVRIWDPGTGREIRTFKGHTTPTTCLAFSPDGKQIASGSLDGSMKLWDTATGNETRTFFHGIGSCTAVAFTPNGHFLVFTSEKSITVADLRTGQISLSRSIRSRSAAWRSVPTASVLSPAVKTVPSGSGTRFRFRSARG